MAAMKAEGVPYEERMAKREEVTHPKPLADFLFGAFEAFRQEAQRVATTQPHWAQVALVDARSGTNLTSIIGSPGFLPKLLEPGELKDLARAPRPQMSSSVSAL